MSIETIMNGSLTNHYIYITGKNNKIVQEIQPPLRNVISVELVSALIPSSEYSVENDRNELIINDITYTIENRDYDTLVLLNELKNKISKNISINLNPDDTYTFNSNEPFIIKYTDFSRMIGIHNTTSSVKINELNLLKTDRINLCGTDAIQLYSSIDDYINRGKRSDVSAPLAIFYMGDVEKGRHIQYKHNGNPRVFFPIERLREIHFTFLRGHEKKLYNFHNMNYYIQLCIQTLDHIPNDKKKTISPIKKQITNINNFNKTKTTIKYGFISILIYIIGYFIWKRFFSHST